MTYMFAADFSQRQPAASFLAKDGIRLDAFWETRLQLGLHPRNKNLEKFAPPLRTLPVLLSAWPYLEIAVYARTLPVQALHQICPRPSLRVRTLDVALPPTLTTKVAWVKLVFPTNFWIRGTSTSFRPSVTSFSPTSSSILAAGRDRWAKQILSTRLKRAIAAETSIGTPHSDFS